MERILIYVILMLVVISIIVSNILSFRYNKYKRNAIDAKRMTRNINVIKSIEQSKQLIDFMGTVCKDVTVLKFKSFQDNHDTKKITRRQVENLINESASDINKYINLDEINFTDTMLFTREFCDWFIIQSTILMAKELTENLVDNIIE